MMVAYVKFYWLKCHWLISNVVIWLIIILIGYHLIRFSSYNFCCCYFAFNLDDKL